ncbi:MAG: hypothetical protein ACK5TP_08525 [bacterium]
MTAGPQTAPLPTPAAGAPTRDGARWLWLSATILVASLLVGLVLWLGSRPRAYSQASPQDVLLSINAMVKDGNAERIGDLFLADSVEQRATLIRLGSLMGTLQDLGKAAQRRFPKEVAVLREQLKRQAAGQGQSIIDKLAKGGQGAQAAFSRPATPQERNLRQDQFKDASLQLLSDPFGWLQENQSRLGVAEVDDETAVLTFDKQPLLGGIAQMKMSGGRWWLILPLQLPGVAQFAPQTRNEWSIIASLIRVVDKALQELADDIDSGKAARLEDVPRLAGEKAFIPAAIVMVMYGKEMDARARRERTVAQFRKRWNKFMDDRADPDDLRKALTETVNKAAIEELDALVRARAADRNTVELPKIAEMQDTDLINLVEGWLTKRGGPLRLTQPMTIDQINAASAAIDAKAKSGIRTRPTPIAGK